MKHVIRTFAAAFTLAFFSQTAFTKPIDPKMECKNNTCGTFRAGMYRVKNTTTMNVMLEKQKGERLDIKLFGANGQLLHQERIGKWPTKLGRKLNFSEMKDGNYLLEISGEREKIVKNIRLSTDDISEVRRTLITMN